VLLVTDQWVISGEERSKHDMLFAQQNPVGGYLSGPLHPLRLTLCSPAYSTDIHIVSAVNSFTGLCPSVIQLTDCYVSLFSCNYISPVTVA